MGVPVTRSDLRAQGRSPTRRDAAEGYLLEAHLQDLLAKYPSLLAGDGVNRSAPRRWLLVSKEAGSPDREDAGARWSLDHLFLDQDAVPTLVEVKRSTRHAHPARGRRPDARLRRQRRRLPADRAAPGDGARPTAAGGPAGAAAELIAEALGSGGRPDDFWHAVKTNLQAGQDPARLRRRRDPARAPADRRVPQRPDGPRRGPRHRHPAVRGPGCRRATTSRPSCPP